jgi:hypothetical protein
MPADRYDIFRRSANAEPIWSGSCDSLIRAQQRIAELKCLAPNEEFAIFDMEESRFVQSFLTASA